MKSFKKHTIRFRRSNGQRGSVIVLVVATLALLAVIGTVYIVSARSERGSAQAGSVALNLDLAQQAVNDAAVQAIGESMFDAKGIIGGGNGGVSGGKGFQGAFGGTTALPGAAARMYDMPEFNTIKRASQGIRDQSWLVSNLYRPGYEITNYFQNNISMYNDMTMPQMLGAYKIGMTTYISPSVFDPTTGGYTLPVYVNASGWTYPVPNVGMFNVVPDPSVGPPTMVRADNSTGPSLPDAIVQLLPFSDASGVRYRFGLRIVDTSRMANLNVGMTYADRGWNQYAWDGTYANGYNLANPYIFASGKNDFAGADAMDRMGGSATLDYPARAGGYRAFRPGYDPCQLWGQAILRLDCPQTWGLAPFDLSDELGLRSYGMLGTMSVPRPASSVMWPNNLGNRIVTTANSPQTPPNFHRDYYTNYSYARDLRAGTLLDPVDNAGNPLAYVLQYSNGGAVGSFPGGVNVWPSYPARVGVGVDISASSAMGAPEAANILAATATNIATAMNKLPTLTTPYYTRNEAAAFAANYLAYRWSDWDTVSCDLAGNEIKAWYLVNGPSFIDSQGICIRNGSGAQEFGTLATDYDLDSGTANVTVLGYTAQPFINEIVITESASTVAGVTTTKTDDFAVELYNPYNVPLSLSDYKLVVLSTTDVGPTAANTYDLSADDTKTKFIPARGYFVIAKNGGVLASGVTESATQIPGTEEFTGTVKMDTQKSGEPTFTIVANASETNPSKKICLMRKYTPRPPAAPMSGLAAVDQFDMSAFNAFPAVDGTNTYSICRPNDEKNVDDPDFLNWLGRWKATVSFRDPPQPSKDSQTLGSANSDTGAAKGVPLYSRVAMASRLPFENIGDFNKIMRIANQIDTANGVPAGESAIADQLIRVTEATNSEGTIHFDFDSDDPARQMLNCFSMVDRVTDYTINLGDNDYDHRGMSKLRIPGQININTASPEVLRSIPFFRDHPDKLSMILARRWCTTNNDPALDNRFPGGFVGGLRAKDQVPAPVGGEVPEAGYPAGSNPYGFRSMFELKEFLNVPGAATIADRDQNWARVYNYLTTRSDTFVVYAYLEAVRVNPRYTGATKFDNEWDWYTTNYNPSNTPIIGVSENPNDSTHALQLMGRRRWVAIVDRSFANYSRNKLNRMMMSPPEYTADPNFAMPRVVAQKDLPR